MVVMPGTVKVPFTSVVPPLKVTLPEPVTLEVRFVLLAVKARVVPEDNVKVPVVSLPPASAKVPALTFTVPELLNKTPLKKVVLGPAALVKVAPARLLNWPVGPEGSKVWS